MKKHLPIAEEPTFPMRINKYLAWKGHCTRREADAFVSAGKVLINGAVAELGTKVTEADKVEVRFRTKTHRYFALHKPRGVITHSPQKGEKDIASLITIKGVFPIGRLDKDSSGLIILTDDGRITDKLLNPEQEHEKEYVVTTKEDLTEGALHRMERGMKIEDEETKPATVRRLGTRKFSIVLTEGKKHQIRRMCAALGLTVASLERIRIMNVLLGTLKPGECRPIEGAERSGLLALLGISV